MFSSWLSDAQAKLNGVIGTEDGASGDSDKSESADAGPTDFWSGLAKMKDQVQSSLQDTIEHYKEDFDSSSSSENKEMFPWTGFENEESIKSQILSLSSDERNFLMPPPIETDFQFDETHIRIAGSTLKVDNVLKDMRYKLVPKQVNETEFWTNYFYRVSLIKQQSQLTKVTRGSDISTENSRSINTNTTIQETSNTNQTSTDADDDEDDNSGDDSDGFDISDIHNSTKEKNETSNRKDETIKKTKLEQKPKPNEIGSTLPETTTIKAKIEEKKSSPEDFLFDDLDRELDELELPADLDVGDAWLDDFDM